MPGNKTVREHDGVYEARVLIYIYNTSSIMGMCSI
jgi:hypothetical protein